MALSREQQQNVARLMRAAKNQGATRKQTKALIEAAGVESNYRHLNYGDRDSKGILQQRPSQGWGPAGESIEKDAAQFLNKAKQVKSPGSAGALAQSVQGSAFPARYDQRNKEAETLLGKTPIATGSAPMAAKATAYGAPDPNQAKLAALVKYSQQRGRPGALLNLVTGVKAAEAATTPTTTTSTAPANAPAANDASGVAAQLTERASTIDAKKLPYKWGGGHGGPVDPASAEPLDCSGAVSAVLGVNPRVSGEFSKWGKPGDGGGDGVTVYSNPEHVLMKIKGRFFGTSKSNPGGGAGWISQDQISPEYLRGFTARHVK